MTKEEILAKMTAQELPIPRPRDVGKFYAAWLSKVYDQLSAEQQAEAITLGGVVHDRSTYLIPVLKVDEIDGWLMQRSVGPDRPLKSDGSIA